MPRRRSRRRTSQRLAGPLAALALGLLVLAGAVALILRGDTTPRPTHIARSASSTPAAIAPAPIVSRATAPPVATAEPTTETTALPATSAAPAPTPSRIATPRAGPKLALIVDDCGQWPQTERGFIALSAPVTLSVLPHVRYGDTIAQEAVAAGKGVMLHLPMEPRSGIYPGPGEIRVAMDDAAIAAQVRDDLASVPLATGVNNHEGSRATADDRVMRDVANVLAEHHVFFVDSRTSAATVAQRDTEAAGIPTARRDVFLDDVADVNAIEGQLRRAADIAKTNGSAIAIGHPRETTLAAVRALVPELQAQGIDFVLVRDLVR